MNRDQLNSLSMEGKLKLALILASGEPELKTLIQGCLDDLQTVKPMLIEAHGLIQKMKARNDR